MPDRPSRRALIVRGGWEGHAPVEATERFVPFLKEHGFSVQVSDSLDVYVDAELLEQTDLIVQCWTQGEITDAQVFGLSDAVRAGTGLAGWHGGIVDAFRWAPDYLHMTGGQFAAHPGKFVHYEVSVVPERAEHPIVAGLDPVGAFHRAVLVPDRRQHRRARHDLFSRRSPTPPGGRTSSRQPSGPGNGGSDACSCPRSVTVSRTWTSPRCGPSPNAGCSGPAARSRRPSERSRTRDGTSAARHRPLDGRARLGDRRRVRAGARGGRPRDLPRAGDHRQRQHRRRHRDATDGPAPGPARTPRHPGRARRGRSAHAPVAPRAHRSTRDGSHHRAW